MVSFIQAVAVLVFAAIGAWIAARQMVIANDRLHMDKFDRLYAKRVAVYEVTREILAKVFGNGVSESDLRVYGLSALDAQFLFDEPMFQYLKQIRYHIAELNLISENIEATIAGTPERGDYLKRKTDNLNWLIAQGDEHSGFAARFHPFLVHEFPKRSWLLRWPT
jgi:hypothetical protein